MSSWLSNNGVWWKHPRNSAIQVQFYGTFLKCIGSKETKKQGIEMCSAITEHISLLIPIILLLVIMVNDSDKSFDDFQQIIQNVYWMKIFIAC